MSRKTSRWPAALLLLAIGLVTGLALTYFLALPQVTTFSPAPGAQNVSSRAPLRLTFSQAMQPDSVANALQIQPALAGQTAWAGNTFIFTPAAAWPAGTPITVTLTGAKSLRGWPLRGQSGWNFTIGYTRLVYLSGSIPNLWSAHLTAEPPPQQLTEAPFGIADFAVSPDGTCLVYSVWRADGGADLREMNPDGTDAADLHLCPNAACLAPVFSPDGERVAYEQQALVNERGGEVTLAEPHVYVLTRATQQTVPIGDPDSETRYPRWSPDGRLSYFDPARQALVVHDLASGAETYIPNRSGESGTWSPDSQYLVFPEVILPDETGEPQRYYTPLLRVTVATNAILNLSGTDMVEDASPAYSPDGRWLAFGRKSSAANQWTPGRQLWLMAADGSAAQAVTADPLYNHSAFAWSPNGDQLVYMRFNVTEPQKPAEIWIMPADGIAPHMLVTGGYLPKWLP